MVEEFKVLSCVSFGAQLLEQDAWEQGLSWNPDVIAAQGTGGDPGPYYLGADAPFAGATIGKKLLEQIIIPAKKRGIPFIISQGAMAGANGQLARHLGWVNDIAKEANFKLRVAVIPGELEKEYLKEKIRAGSKIKRLVNTKRLPEYLTEEEVERSTHIVAQMGPEPIMKAFDFNIDGVITGRALDNALHMALPLKKGFDIALATHMAKSVECGALVAYPQALDSVFAILKKDHFLIRPTSSNRRCTTVSVVAHSFYERSDPNLEEIPGGALDISKAKYEQYDDRTVKVSGSRFIPAPYTLKIEGARQLGYRSISIFGIRDERMISCIDWFLGEARKETERKFYPLSPSKDYDLNFRIYGKNGVLGEAEPIKAINSHELGVIIDVVAPDEGVSSDVCNVARAFITHGNYPGQLSTAANIAYPFSPMVHNLGPVYGWNIWHLLEVDDPCEPFKINVKEFPTKRE